MRNASFKLTQQQIRDRTKFVTRRLGWNHIKAGDLIQPVVQGMGLRKGQKVEKIGCPIRIMGVRKEKLCDITQEECVKEGFPEMTPAEFVQMFCFANNCDHDIIVNRIEFDYAVEVQ